MSKRAARNPAIAISPSGYQISIVRCAIALLLVLVGIAWIVVFIHFAKDASLYDPKLGGAKPDNPLPWMADLERWNYLIGFVLIFAGMTAASHRLTPFGHGRGVVIGMLFSFLFGLLYILVYYFMGDNISKIPVMKDLDQYNLLVGIGFMAVGFTFATKWE